MPAFASVHATVSPRRVVKGLPESGALDADGPTFEGVARSIRLDRDLPLTRRCEGVTEFVGAVHDVLVVVVGLVRGAEAWIRHDRTRRIVTGTPMVAARFGATSERPPP